jgi:hypothetical protein
MSDNGPAGQRQDEPASVLRTAVLAVLDDWGPKDRDTNYVVVQRRLLDALSDALAASSGTALPAPQESTMGDGAPERRG